MNVGDILGRKGARVVTLTPRTPVAIAIRRMRTEGIGAVVVSDDGEHPLGLVGERDIVRALAEFGCDLLDMPIDRISMAGETCHPADTITTVMRKMTRHRVRHLPVVDAGRLRGLISIGDVVKNRVEELELEASVLRDAYFASH